MKRIICISALLLMISLVFTACKNNNSDIEKTPNSDPSDNGAITNPTDKNPSSNNTETSEGGLKYALLDDGTYAVSIAKGNNLEKIEIPESYNGQPVTVIRSFNANVATENTTLKEIVVPNSITTIEKRAFLKCTSLLSIDLPNSVRVIGEGAFSDCTSLTTVTVPNTLTCLGDYAFTRCTSLEFNIYDNVYYLGNNANPYLICFKTTSNTKTAYTIHSNTKFIYSGAFSACMNLKNITIPKNVIGIGMDAFLNCAKLENVNIPEYVTEIGKYAFYGCKSLGELTVPGNVEAIGEYAFSGCDSLVGVVIEYGTVKIGERAFKDCKKLGYVSISDTVASIGEGAFNGCAALTDVFYGLGESDFSKIEIGALNSYFENAKRHYSYVP